MTQFVQTDISLLNDQRILNPTRNPLAASMRRLAMHAESKSELVGIKKDKDNLIKQFPQLDRTFDLSEAGDSNLEDARAQL